ncbi:MAG: hypothetical protein WCI02_18320 [Planctomycetota bacterium]
MNRSKRQRNSDGMLAYRRSLFGLLLISTACWSPWCAGDDFPTQNQLGKQVFQFGPAQAIGLCYSHSSVSSTCIPNAGVGLPPPLPTQTVAEFPAYGNLPEPPRLFAAPSNSSAPPSSGTGASYPGGSVPTVAHPASATSDVILASGNTLRSDEERVTVRLGEPFPIDAGLRSNSSSTFTSSNVAPSMLSAHGASSNSQAPLAPSSALGSRQPQRVKPQTVRSQSSSHKASDSNQSATIDNGPNHLKIVKSEAIAAHSPVRLSFSNASVTAAPIPRSVNSYAVMRNGTEIPVNIRPMDPDSKVLQSVKTSAQPLVSAIQPVVAPETIHDSSLDNEPSLALDSYSETTSINESDENGREQLVEGSIRDTYAISDSTSQSASNIPSGNAVQNPSPPSVPLPAPGLHKQTFAESSNFPVPGLLPPNTNEPSTSRIAELTAKAPVQVADVPVQAIISFASTSKSAMVKVVPVEGHPSHIHESPNELSNTDRDLPPAFKDTNEGAAGIPSPSVHAIIHQPPVTEVILATPHALEPDYSYPAHSETNTSEPDEMENTLAEVDEDGPIAPRIDTASKYATPTMQLRDSGRILEDVNQIPRGPTFSSGPLENGVVPEGAPKLEIESHSANEFLVEGKIISIHIEDPVICRAIASNGRVFLVGDQQGETVVAMRTAESVEPVYVKVAVVSAWRNTRLGGLDLEQLRAAIANVAPEANLRMQPQSDGSLWVLGTVDSNGKAKRVMELTRRMVLVPVVDKLEVR